MRLFFATVLAFAALVPTASAATSGVNVNTVPLSEAGWAKVAESHARTVRVWAFMSEIENSPGVLSTRVDEYRAFADRARTLGASTVITLMAAPGSASPPDPATYARVAQELAAALKGHGVSGYEVWNEPDDAPYWAPAPSPAAYAALLRAAYPAFKAGDPSAAVVTGGLVANDYDFLQALYDNGAKGSFDAVGIHTDTACLTTDPREYYREPSGRIGRYSFTGYREVRYTMVANGDDKPIWITEMGWSTTDAICNVGERAGTKPGGVAAAQQADFLTKAYGCLKNDPYVAESMWFSLADIDSSSPDYDRRLGLLDQSLNAKPAFGAFQNAAGVGAIPCGGALDKTPPTVRFVSPATNQQYLTVLKIGVAADDAQGVTNLDLFVDGKEVPVVTKSQTATAAKFSLTWQGAKQLSYGPHTLVAKAYDEAKNLGTATVKVIKVGGGKYKISIGTKIDLKLGKIKHRKLSLKGKIVPTQDLDTTITGKTEIVFERKQGKRWIGTSRFAKGAKTGYRFTYKFKKPGTWRMKVKFIPKKGSPFKASSLPTKTFKVR
jgi:Bacterial Ig domain